ncbi:hypothetical protein, partial [Idiomarina sp. ST10R2A5]|uniref:hypothetical protein n=1 Tax=Idiomarina sp. ST10R2A5 TaxID=3418368 RepID=UPI003EC8A75E
MNTHYPYEPSQQHLTTVSGGAYEVEDIQSVEPDIGDPWIFLNNCFGGGVDEELLDTVRAAYYLHPQNGLQNSRLH